MAGAFRKDSILQQAGVAGAMEGGLPVDEHLRAIASVLGPWLTEVGGGDRELTDEATGQYVAVTREESIRVDDAVNGRRLAELVHGVPYGPEVRQAASDLLSWAEGLAYESNKAVSSACRLLEDFADTAAELGMPMVREKHEHDEGFTLYVPLRSEGLPEGYQPQATLYLMGVPSVAISHSWQLGKADTLFIRLSTSDAETTSKHVKDRLGEELVRMAMVLGRVAK